MESCRGYNAPPRVLSACLSQVLPIWPPACRRWELFRSVKGAPAHSERSPNRKLPFPLVQRLFGLRRVRSRPRGLCAPQGSLDRARRGPYAPTKREWERCRASGCPALTTASPWVRPSVAATGGYRVSFTHKLCYRPLCERTVPRRKRIDNRLTHDSDFRTAPCSTGKHFGGRDKENP
jgi:hypothetical protein